MKLNFKSYNFTTKEEQGNTLIFDIVRKKYVVLTPEEWVRQHIVHFLVDEISVPLGLISLERALTFNGLKKRFDICVANNTGKMFLLVECKAPGVALSNATLHQAGIYHQTLGVQCILLSNGLNSVGMLWDESNEKFVQVSEIPNYSLWS